MADSAYLISYPQSSSIGSVDIWLQGVAVVLPQVQQELLPVRVEFATLSLYVGLILGATTWGVMADLIGRKLSFNVGDVLGRLRWRYLFYSFRNEPDNAVFGGSVWNRSWSISKFRHFCGLGGVCWFRHWRKVRL